MYTFQKLSPCLRFELGFPRWTDPSYNYQTHHNQLTVADKRSIHSVHVRGKWTTLIARVILVIDEKLWNTTLKMCITRNFSVCCDREFPNQENLWRSKNSLGKIALREINPVSIQYSRLRRYVVTIMLLNRIAIQ